MKQPKLLLFLLVTFVIAACTSTKNVADSSTREIGNVYSIVNFLASDSLKGRFPGTPESDIAAKYIRDRLVQHGYKPLDNNGIQNFDLTVSQKLGANSSLTIDGKELQLGKDFTVLSTSSEGELTAKVCFVGYGLSVDQDGLKKDDYQNLDVTGCWVLMLLGSPSKRFELYASHQSKAIVARDKGAKGVIFVAQPTDDPDSELLPFALREASVGIPCLQVTREVVDNVLKKENRTLAIVEKNLANDLNTLNSLTDYTASAQTDIESNRINACNVVMKLEGSDPILKSETIVIGAHYDHLGFGGKGSGSRRPDENAIHYGADDNASGVALVMLLAENLVKRKEQLKRSVVVVLFGAEEQGIVGSKYFTANVPEEAGKIVTMLNFDMVGRLTAERSLQVSGVGTFEQGEELVSSAANPDSLKLTLSKGGFGPSDHAPFYAKRIPVLYFTTGAHADYHTPYDTPEKLSYTGIHQVEKFTEDVVVKLATLASAPVYQSAGDSDMNSSSHRRFKVTLGIIPDFTSGGSDGMRADVVSEGRPAHNAGMESGDIIIAINKKAVHNIQDYMQRLSELKEGDLAEVTVKRGDEEVTLHIQL